jgi:hypothetical protein
MVASGAGHFAVFDGDFAPRLLSLLFDPFCRRDFSRSTRGKVAAATSTTKLA